MFIIFIAADYFKNDLLFLMNCADKNTFAAVKSIDTNKNIHPAFMIDN